MGIDFFMNDRYKVLFCLSERQIDVNGKLFTPLSQEQISEIVGISKATVNTVIKDLKKEKYIVQQSKTRGKYILTDKAKLVLSKIEKLCTEASV
jgi:predicted transcriptional regulator